MDKLDPTTEYLLKLGLPLTQRNWLGIEYFGDKCLEDLEGEELANLPEGFEHWPVDTVPVN